MTNLVSTPEDSEMFTSALTQLVKGMCVLEYSWSVEQKACDAVKTDWSCLSLLHCSRCCHESCASKDNLPYAPCAFPFNKGNNLSIA